MLDRLALIALVAGCNQVWGLDATRLVDATGGEQLVDLDLDGTVDSVDPCLAPVRDADDDLDADGTPAATDLCPFQQGGTDLDMDGVASGCDPFPGASGDHLRCYMSFGSTELNARLWTSREQPGDWTSREGELFTPTPNPTPTSVLATIDLEASAEMTYEAVVSLDNASPAIHAFRLWVRAGETASAQDIGCELSGNASSTRLAIVRGNDMDQGMTITQLLPFPKSMPIRMRVTLSPTASPNVRCTVLDWLATPPVVKATIAPLPPGRVAFGTENLQAHVSALAIYERTTLEPL